MADIRIQRTTSQSIYLYNLSLKQTKNDELYGYGIRVFKNGAWGFAHCNVFTKEKVIETVKKSLKTAELSGIRKRGAGLKLATERSYQAVYKNTTSN